MCSGDLLFQCILEVWISSNIAQVYSDSQRHQLAAGGLTHTVTFM